MERDVEELEGNIEELALDLPHDVGIAMGSVEHLTWGFRSEN